MFEIYFLLGLLLVGAWLAINVRSILSSVICAGVVGFALCLVFLILRAPDVAITQLIVEIIVLVMLVRVTGVRQDITDHLSSPKEWFVYLSLAIFMVMVGCFSLATFRALPEFGFPLYPPFSLSGPTGAISAILLNVGFLNTLAALAVFCAAVIGTMAILRKKGRKALNERDVFDS